MHTGPALRTQEQFPWLSQAGPCAQSVFETVGGFFSSVNTSCQESNGNGPGWKISSLVVGICATVLLISLLRIPTRLTITFLAGVLLCVLVFQAHQSKEALNESMNHSFVSSATGSPQKEG